MNAEVVVPADITIREAMKKLSQTGEKALVVVEKDDRLLGTLSDGDLRKAILRGVQVNEAISKIYQRTPSTLIEGEFNTADAKRIFTENKFDLIPVVTAGGKLVDVLFWEHVFLVPKEKDPLPDGVSVVIMAGGKGTRLEPFTRVLPKPLIPVHEKPIIEHVIAQFLEYKASKFITINYKARILRAFFEEVAPEFSLELVEEESPLGTIGAVGLVKTALTEPFFLTNCDILVKANYLDLYNFHTSNGFAMTLVASTKNFSIPYGACQLNSEGDLEELHEKPEFDFLVNVGLYVINPELIELIPENQSFDITELISLAKGLDNAKIGIFPIDESEWVDIGQWTEYQKAVERL